MCLPLYWTLYIVSFNTQNNSPDIVLILFFQMRKLSVPVNYIFATNYTKINIYHAHGFVDQEFRWGWLVFTSQCLWPQTEHLKAGSAIIWRLIHSQVRSWCWWMRRTSVLFSHGLLCSSWEHGGWILKVSVERGERDHFYDERGSYGSVNFCHILLIKWLCDYEECPISREEVDFSW